MLDFPTICFFVNLLVIQALVLPLYYAIRVSKWQQALLAITGMVSLGVITPRLLVFYVPFWLFVALLHRVTCWCRGTRIARVVFVLSLVALLVPLVAWKLLPVHFVNLFNLLTHHFLWTYCRPLGVIDSIKDYLLPLGLSFATFRALDLLIQTYVDAIPRQTISRILAYGFFAPVQIVGPLVEFRELGDSGNAARRFRLDEFVSGAGLVFIGLTKVYVLAFPLRSSREIFTYADVNPTLTVWLHLILFTWYFYLNFAGFTDIAVGAARLFGYRVQGNFNRPYFRSNIQLFWANWHMSLTRWAQRNVFVPVGGYRKRTQTRAIFATMMTIALWHDISIPLALFGLIHATALYANRLWQDHPAAKRKAPSRFNTIAAACATQLFVTLTFPLLALPMEAIPMFYGRLIGLEYAG